jgi:hypothetical protein
MIDFDALAERALIEFPDLVSSCRTLENKLRIYLRDGSYIDFWWGMKLQGKFAYHWERRALDGPCAISRAKKHEGTGKPPVPSTACSRDFFYFFSSNQVLRMAEASISAPLMFLRVAMMFCSLLSHSGTSGTSRATSC